MNVYEEQVKIYDRRIKRIEDNPDQKFLRSTKLFYELERESCIERLQAWKEGKPFAVGNYTWSLLTAMGFKAMEWGSISMTSKSDFAALSDAMRGVGLPDDACDITTSGLTMYVTGRLPLPALAVVSGTCDPIWLSMNALAHMYNIPSFCIDTKLVPTYDAIRYWADQLGELIEFAESRVPGIKYDEDRLIELQDIDRQARDCLREVYEVRKRVPCPIAGRDSFRSPRAPSRFTNPHKALEWHRARRDELLERADKGIGAVPEEKLRLMWVVGGAVSSNPFDYLERRGVTVPIYVTGSIARDAGKEVIPDEKELGRKLIPLEEEARTTHNNVWGSLGRFWVDDIIYMCRDLKIDGIVYFEQVGCPTTVGLTKAVSDTAEKELRVPTLRVETRVIDASFYNQQQFEAKLGEFIDTCLARKGIN